jgi:hypothetical protein
LTLTTVAPTRFRVRRPTDGRPLPAIASPRLARLAGPDGALGVDVAGETLTMRVAAVAERFPGATARPGRDFLVLDRKALVTALNAERPGAGFTTEAWVDGPERAVARVAARLQRPPFDVLAVDSQDERRRELERAPVAAAALTLLTVAAAVAAVLALVGLLLGTVAQLRDERGELFDLESQGIGPGRLRRQVRIRATIVIAIGLAGAAVTATALSVLVVRLVTLTADAGPNEPPLVLAVDWYLIVAALAAFVVSVVVALGAVTARAFREEAAGRAAEAV